MLKDNYDYTIDYSTAEVIFTPKHIIHFDSDLAFEYQFSDYQYQKNFIGGSLKNNGNYKSRFDIGFYNEDDKNQKDPLSGCLRLKQADDTFQEGSGYLGCCFTDFGSGSCRRKSCSSDPKAQSSWLGTSTLSLALRWDAF